MTTPDDTATTASTDAATSSSDAKAKGRTKLKSKGVGEAKGKRSLNLSLPYEDYQRLALHALDEDITISDVVSNLARTHLRRVHLSRTAVRGETV